MTEQKKQEKIENVQKPKISKAKKKLEKEIKGADKKIEIKKFEHADARTMAQLEPFDYLRFVLMTEKSIQLIETQNKMVFVANRKATKSDIKKSVENAFQTPVTRVTTVIDQKGRKKAFIKFAKEGMAGEIAIRLGII